MSTKPPFSLRPKAALIALLSAVAMTAGGCANTPPQTPVDRLGELRLGRPAPALRPRAVAPSETFVDPTPILPVTLDTATGRVAAYLDRAGFALEERTDAGDQIVSATRMGAPTVLTGEAVCGLQAMHRPDIASTDLTVRLTPAPGGVQVQTTARFVEVDTKLLSGTLSRQTCRSRGVLEAAVRRAARGG